MRLLALEIPEQPSEQRAWLERHLVGPELAQLVAELQAVRAANDSRQNLDEILGVKSGALMSEGLSALSDEQLRLLLANPAVLLELQERVLLNGGNYWEKLTSKSAELDSLATAGWQRLSNSVGVQRSTTGPTIAPSTISAQSSGQAWYRHPAWCAAAIAASVLAVVLALKPDASTSGAIVAWGWSKPGAIEQALPADKYLNTLADEAQEWFNKQPETRQEVARRIFEFRQGCSTVMMAEHRPLKPADKAWLLERCRAWASKLDLQLAALEDGADPFTARAAVDDVANKLIIALRERAGQV